MKVKESIYLKTINKQVLLGAWTPSLSFITHIIHSAECILKWELFTEYFYLLKILCFKELHVEYFIPTQTMETKSF